MTRISFKLPSLLLVCTTMLPYAAYAQSAAASAASTGAQSPAAVPRSVPFNGALVTPSGDARTGTVLLTFGLYTDQKDGTPLWTEQQLVTLDASGRYSAILGSASAAGLPAEAFAAGTPKWLGVTVEGEKEQPRFMLLSVPYALKAGDADTVGGKPVSEFVVRSNLFDTVKSTLKEQGYAPKPSSPSSTVNRIVKFIGGNNEPGDSIMVENGGRIGVNNPTNLWQPYQTFRLDNSAAQGSGLTLAATSAGGHYYTLVSTGAAAGTGAGFLTIYDEGAGQFRMVIDPIGRIGIGTAAPMTRLHVEGNSGIFVHGTPGIAVDAETSSGGEAVYAECLQSGNNCYAVEGYAPTGDYAGYFYGGKGVYAESDDSSQPGLDGNAYGSSSYGVSGESASYRGGYIKSDSAVLYSLYVDDVDGPTQGTAALNVRGTIRGEGNLVINGSKAGFVVDLVQNVDAGELEAGDVVVIVGNAPPVLGEIPVVTVKKASAAYDTGVAGVVDQAWYAPDSAMKTAYEHQEEALRTAMAARFRARHAAARGKGNKPENVPIPESTITDAEGTLHTIPDATSIGPGAYASVVTLGAYKVIKADATFGAIHAGDLLTTSTHAGYAMKVSDKVAAIGAIIGKALANLDSGTGTIPVMVLQK